MKLIVSLFLLFHVVLTSAQTSVSGGIFQNTTWSLSGSPYTVTGSIVVFPGNTLTIEPGVTVLIDNTTSNDLYIETRGTLTMIGTNQAQITVRTVNDTTAVGWKGFKCTSSQGGVLNADRFNVSNAEIPFAYEAPLSLYEYTNCTFSYCGQAITVGNETVLNNCQFIGNQSAVYGWSYFTISNCHFEGNTTAVNAWSTRFILTNTTFTENQNAVVFSSGVFDTMLIENCTFLNNTIAVSGPNNGTIGLCTFLDNTVGIQGSYACDIVNNVFNYNELALNVSVATNLSNNQINSNFGGVRISDISSSLNAPIVTNNEICGNITFNVDNNTNVNYSLLSNCFCGLDSAQIEAYLLDGYDDITKGLINYQVYDSSCSTILSTVSKFGSIANLETLSFDFSFTNPAQSEIQFYYPETIEQIELYDLIGHQYILKPNGQNRFDVSELPAGIFILRKVNSVGTNQKLLKI